MDELLKKLGLLINTIEKNQEKETKEVLVKQIEELQTEIKKIGTFTEGDKQKLAKFDEMSEKVTKMEKVVDELMKGGVQTPDQTEDFVKFEKELNTYFKTGSKTELISKAFSSTEGAVLIPTPRANEIIKQIKEVSPVLRDAKMYTIANGNSLTIPVKNAGTNNTSKQAEGAARGTESTLSYGKLELKVDKLTTWVNVTSEMIEDSDFNVVAEVNETSREYIADYLSKKVWNGATSDNIVGIYQDTAVTSGALETATANVVTWEDLDKLIMSLPPSVRAKSALYVSTAMLTAMRTFKDKDDRPLYTESLVNGTPGLYRGYKVYEDVFMQDLTGGNYPAFFGDMKKFYAWLNRKGVYMEKDRQAGNDTYDFYTRIRIGGKVRDKNQGKLLKIKSE